MHGWRELGRAAESSYAWVVGAPALGAGTSERRGSLLVEVVEFGADLVGVGVVQLGEDGECVLPGLAGSVALTGGVVGVAQVRQRLGLEIAVAEIPAQRECVLVARDGLPVVAEVVVDVTEAVPGVRLAVTVTELLLEFEGLLAIGEGLSVVAEQSVGPPDGVEGQRLPDLVASGLGQLQRLQ